MVVQLEPFPGAVQGSLELPGSKSISNRVLIIRALSELDFPIEGLAEAQDTQTLIRLLQDPSGTLDAGPAGTTFRFLTAFLSLQLGNQLLTGSQRMKQRPIGLLVEALQELGAQITYQEQEGYPPLQIGSFNPAHQQTRHLVIPASTSSQFISALLLIAPVLPRGLDLELSGFIVSRPYIQMTLNIMAYFGITSQWEDNRILVDPQPYQGRSYKVESDWSAVSYYYALAALAPEADLRISQFFKESVQGDAVLGEMMKAFGVHSNFDGETLHLTKSKGTPAPEVFEFDFLECPDLAQTLAVICAGLGVPAWFKGLSTLRVKETDRIQALIQELEKVNVSVQAIGDDQIKISGKAKVAAYPLFETYEDHRMAMAFAPLACLGGIRIAEPQVVGKSYPSFWEDFSKLGFQVQQQS